MDWRVAKFADKAELVSNAGLRVFWLCNQDQAGGSSRRISGGRAVNDGIRLINVLRGSGHQKRGAYVNEDRW